MDMTKNKFFLFLLLFLIHVSQAFAQTDNAYRNALNPHYWKNRKPHAGYWQQDVAYKIEASINERSNVIEATEELTYWNNSPHTLDVVYFHLYQNAFTKGSYLEELHRVNDQKIRRMGKYQQQGLGTLVEQLKVDGIICKTSLDNTILKVYLPKPLQPGSSVKFTMNFATFFDSGDFRRRMSVYNSWGFRHFNGVHWYPRIAVFDGKKGWDTDQHLNKELYGDYGLFDVKLTFASNYIVEATGAIQNEEEVLPAELRAKLDIKNFANKPFGQAPSIIIPYDSSQRKTWHFIANNVHDFAFTADPHYRIGETKWNGIRCIAVALEPHASRWQNASDYVAKIIKTFSEDFGMYEYPKMVAADANDGMEYPMLTLDSGNDPDFHGLLVHEIGHNWFYGMIGNNETYRAALDEGFTQFLTAWGLQKIDGDTMIETPEKNKYKRKHREPKLVKDRNVYNRYMFDAMRDQDKALNTHSNDFHSALGHENGYSNVYHKTATMLYNLQYVLGDSLFQNAMKHYVAKWKFAHPYFEDFTSSIMEYAGQDLSWFFDQWLETTKHTDYGIRSVKKGLARDQYMIRFKRYGEMQMPIDFTVQAKNGKSYHYHIPNKYFIKKTNAKVLPMWYGWDLLYPEYTAKLNIPSGIKDVIIDTSNRLADIDMMDNYKRPGMKLSPLSRTLKFEHYIANTPSWKKYHMFYRPDFWWNAVDGIKAGIHFDGSFMNYLRKLHGTVWFNTRVLSYTQYRPFEGQGWFDDRSPIDYTLRYDNVFKKISHKIGWGIDSRYIDGFARHSIYASYKINDQSQFKMQAVTQFRKRELNRDYLLFPDEWSSFTTAGKLNSKQNAFLQLFFDHRYKCMRGNGLLRMQLRTPLTYNYAFLQGEVVQNNTWRKLDFKTRLFARYGIGNDLPQESVLFMQGANPEEMMESKWVRSQGIAPRDLSGMSKTDFSNIHMGGGLNLRGYTGYYAIDEDEDGNLFLNYKGKSGAAVNMEIDFDRLFRIRPKYIRDYFHLDAYLFGDAGLMSRSRLNPANISQMNPVNEWSKIRMDAGVGFALTLKKFGPMEKVEPFTIRFDMPFFLSAPPAAKSDFLAWRWVVGIGRSF
jgi:hypothetical protein